MREKKIYLNKNIAIYGMGITGLSTAKTLKDLGANIFCWDDSKKIREKIKSHNFYIKKFWLKQNTVDKIVISPGIDINKCKIKKYLKKNLKKIITDLDLFF
jgi:UDP-N-acetylmuramoylalanine--D-glutamate ligase